MRAVRIVLVAVMLRWPVAAVTTAVLLAVGLGLVLATPGIEWRGRPASEAEAVFAVERDPVADFALTDQDGRRVRLSDHAGKVILVNFVTTRCTTACVQVTRELRGLQQALGSRMGLDVDFLSIGLDPRRDTPVTLRSFARRHGADFAGWAFLSGTGAELEAARAAFGALATQVPGSLKGADYDIEHTTTTYLLDRRGVLRKKLAPGVLTLAGLQEIEAVLGSE